MSWRKISMKYDGTCTVCHDTIKVNEMGLWAKGLGVKHEKCAEVKTLKCGVCGGPAGCPMCEFADDCNIDMVSEICICKKCHDAKEPFTSYQKSIQKKFPLISSIIKP